MPLERNSYEDISNFNKLCSSSFVNAIYNYIIKGLKVINFRNGSTAGLIALFPIQFVSYQLLFIK